MSNQSSHSWIKEPNSREESVTESKESIVGKREKRVERGPKQRNRKVLDWSTAVPEDWFPKGKASGRATSSGSEEACHMPLKESSAVPVGRIDQQSSDDRPSHSWIAKELVPLPISPNESFHNNGFSERESRSYAGGPIRPKRQNSLPSNPADRSERRPPNRLKKFHPPPDRVSSPVSREEHDEVFKSLETFNKLSLASEEHPDKPPEEGTGKGALHRRSRKNKGKGALLVFPPDGPSAPSTSIKTSRQSYKSISRPSTPTKQREKAESQLAYDGSESSLSSEDEERSDLKKLKPKLYVRKRAHYFDPKNFEKELSRHIPRARRGPLARAMFYSRPSFTSMSSRHFG